MGRSTVSWQGKPSTGCQRASPSSSGSVVFRGFCASAGDIVCAAAVDIVLVPQFRPSALDQKLGEINFLYTQLGHALLQGVQQVFLQTLLAGRSHKIGDLGLGQ